MPFGAPWPWPVPPWCALPVPPTADTPYPMMPFPMPYPMMPPGHNNKNVAFFPPAMPTPPVFLPQGLPSEWSVMSTVDLPLPSASIAAGYGDWVF